MDSQDSPGTKAKTPPPPTNFSPAGQLLLIRDTTFSFSQPATEYFVYYYDNGMTMLTVQSTPYSTHTTLPGDRHTELPPPNVP